MAAAAAVHKVTSPPQKPVLQLACLAQLAAVVVVATDPGQAPMMRVQAVALVMRYLEVALLVALVALLAVQVQRDRCCLLAVAVAAAAVDTAQGALARLVALEPFPVAAVVEVVAGQP
jgi:hypothetical protein